MKKLFGLMFTCILVFNIAGCGKSQEKTKMNEKEACLVVMKKFPPSADMYRADFAYGIWHISTISKTNPAPAAWIEVATVRDSDGMIEIVKKP